MSVIDFYNEARTAEKHGHRTINRIVKGDTFDIALFVYDNKADFYLHECAQDEFFYVVKGELEMQLEGGSTRLKEGQGILVKAGEKHKHRTPNKVWMLVIAKQPHKHTFYEKIPAEHASILPPGSSFST